jgi:RND family efflux transporter MFP subunit
LLALGLPLSAAELEELDGIMEPHTTVELSFPVEGVVEVIHADRSDRVEAGQEVARLESTVEQAAVYQARAQARRNGEVLAKQASLKFARSKLARIKELFASKAISGLEKEEADTKVSLARMELKQAQEVKEVAAQNLKRTEAVLERRRIKSPISGVVVERYVAPGEFVKENPVVKIAQLDPLRVEVIAPASMFGKVKSNMVAEVMPESPVTGNFSARVTVVDRIIDAASGTFGVRLELPNPDLQLPGGLRCRVKLLPGTEKQFSQVDPSPPAESGAVAKATKPTEPPVPALAPVDSPVPEKASQSVSETSVVAAKPKQPAGVSCALLGPFRSKRRLDQVGSELQGEHEDLAVRKTKQVRTHGYSLLAPPDVIGQKQQRFIARLKAKGISDFLALGKGRFKGRLALGHFKERHLAEERRTELEQQGFRSEIEARFRVRRWLELKSGPGSVDLSTLKHQVEANWPDMELDLVSCVEKTTTGQMEKLVSK